MISEIEDPSDEFVQVSYKILEFEARIFSLERMVFRDLSDRSPNVSEHQFFRKHRSETYRHLASILDRLKTDQPILHEAILRTLSDEEKTLLGLS